MKRLSFYLLAGLLAGAALSATPFFLDFLVPVASAQQPLVSGQRVRVKKLARDIANVRKSIVTTGPSHFQSAAVIVKRKKRMQQFSDALARYPQVSDPDVIAARAEYKLLRVALSAEFKRASGQISKIGDVQKALKTIEINGRKYAVPKTLAIPFNEADAQAWVKASSEARSVAEHNIKQLAKIALNAYLPKNRGTVQSGAAYDSDDVKRLQRWANKMAGSVQGGYKSTARTLDSRMQQSSQAIGNRWQENPKSDKKWIYIGEGKAEEAAAFYIKNLAIAKSSLYLEQALKRDAGQASALIKTIETAKVNFAKNVKAALASSQLPKAKSKNKKMRKFAKQIMDTPRYKFGEFGTIVLTTEKITEHERKDSEIKIDDVEFMLGDTVKLKGTKTTWTYIWTEFNFATPIKDSESGEWYIWWITAKNYTSGSSITPLNSWISGKATKGNRILKSNF